MELTRTAWGVGTLRQAVTTCGSRAARKWGENEEMERNWREKEREEME